MEQILLLKIEPPFVEGLLSARHILDVLHSLLYLNLTSEVDSLIILVLHIRELKASGLLSTPELGGGADRGCKVSLSPASHSTSSH